MSIFIAHHFFCFNISSFLINTSVSSLSISLPNLLPYCDDVTFWFAQLDAFFALHSVPPPHQLRLLYCGMPAPPMRIVQELITNTQPDATYASLKAKVRRRNTESAESRFRKVFTKDEHLGNRSLSEFLSHLVCHHSHCASITLQAYPTEQKVPPPFKYRPGCEFFFHKSSEP